MPKTLLIEPDIFVAEDLEQIVAETFAGATIVRHRMLPDLHEIRQDWDLVIVNASLFDAAPADIKAAFTTLKAFKILVGDQDTPSQGWCPVQTPFTTQSMACALKHGASHHF